MEGESVKETNFSIVYEKKLATRQKKLCWYSISINCEHFFKFLVQLDRLLTEVHWLPLSYKLK